MTTKNSDFPSLTRGQLPGTELGQVHTTTDPAMERVIRAVPGYVEARRAVSTLLEYTKRSRARAVAVRDAVDVAHDTILAALAAGQDIPEDLAAQMPDIAAVPVYEGMSSALGVRIVADGPTALAATIHHDAVTRAHVHLVAQLDEVLFSNGPKILASLGNELQALVTDARKVLTAGGRIADAEDAIEQGRVEEFQASRGLGATYAELRRLHLFWAQTTNHQLTVSTGPDNFRWFLANPLEAVPDFCRLVSRLEYGDPADEKAFTRSGAGLHWPASWTDTDALWWFAAHPDAQPWAPTEQQYGVLDLQLAQAQVKHSRGGRRDGKAVAA